MNAKLWKYVDDTSSEVVPRGSDSNAQQIADKVAQWSSDNRVKLNNEKCKELRISFARDQPELQPIVVNGQELEVVHSAKLLGITITSDLSWNDHTGKVLKKASKCLYFLVQLKRAKLPSKDLVLLYTTYIRSILSYAVPVFYYALTKYLQNDLERVQKRALSIIFRGLAYNKALEVAGIQTISDYNESVCDKTFKYISNNTSHRLRKLLPALNKNQYPLRRNRRYTLPRWRTDRFRNTFIMSSCIK